jgi:paraquat-inducible protein B
MKLIALLMSGLCMNSGLNAMPTADAKESHEALAYQAIEILPVGSKAIQNLRSDLVSLKAKMDEEQQKINCLPANINSQVKTSVKSSLAEISNLKKSVREKEQEMGAYYTSEELKEEQEWRKEQEALAGYNRCARWCLTRNRRCCCSNGAILKWMGITIGGMLLPLIVVGLPILSAEQAN